MVYREPALPRDPYPGDLLLEFRYQATLKRRVLVTASALVFVILVSLSMWGRQGFVVSGVVSLAIIVFVGVNHFREPSWILVVTSEGWWWGFEGRLSSVRVESVSGAVLETPRDAGARLTLIMNDESTRKIGFGLLPPRVEVELCNKLRALECIQVR